MTTLDGQRGDTAVVVAAGGAGVRLGGSVPKALRRLAGEPLLRHAVRRVAGAHGVGLVVVAAPPGQERAVQELLPEAVVVAGGDQRQQSVASALAAVPDQYEIVLVHDAARALAPTSLAESVAAAVRAGHDAVIPVLPVTDTIAQVGPDGAVTANPDRSTLRAVQTPQGFRRTVLVEAHAAAGEGSPTGQGATDDAGLIARLGVPVHTVPGAASALKITTGYDLLLAEALLREEPAGDPAG